MTNQSLAQRERHAQQKVAPPEISLHDVAFECSTLGAAMLDSAQAEVLIRDGSAELFTVPFTEDIFRAICALGPQLDYSLLRHQLEREGKDIDWGALSHLDDGVDLKLPMAERISRLRELWRLRTLSKLGERLVHAPFAIAVKSADLISKIRVRLEEIER